MGRAVSLLSSANIGEPEMDVGDAKPVLRATILLLNRSRAEQNHEREDREEGKILSQVTNN